MTIENQQRTLDWGTIQSRGHMLGHNFFASQLI